MSDWQKILHESVDTLDKLAERFGADVIDVEALQPAFDNFQMRITPNVARHDQGSRRSDVAAVRARRSRSSTSSTA